MQWSLLMRKLLGRKPVEQGSVQFFGKIVTVLVRPVDAPLHVCQLSVTGVGRAGLILDMPQIEVGAVLPGDEGKPLVGRVIENVGFGMPALGQLVLKTHDCGGGKHSGGQLGLSLVEPSRRECRRR